MKIQSRMYQRRAVANLRSDLAEFSHVLAVSPTGSGKTVIASQLIAEEPRWRKVLWLAHRYELIDQAFSTLVALGMDAGVLMAQDERLRGTERANPDARVQVASVQTVASRGVPSDVDLVVFDEAHRAMSDSYQAIADACDGADVLGLTATPCREDGRGLGSFFRTMRVLAMPSDLQASGWTAKPVTFGAPADVAELVEVGLAKDKHTGADYSEKQAARAVDKKALIGRVVSETMRIAPGVPKVVFACNVRHSRRLADEFARAGVAALHIDGKTPALDREAILTGLADGDVEVVCNVDVLSEGWDLPSLGALVIARPTKSKGRFMQMCGRAMRKYGDARPIIIDHGANVQRLDVIPGEDVSWTLEDGVPAPDESVPLARLCEACGAALERGEDVCGECGQEHERVKTPAEDRQEIEARLEEITRAELEARRESEAVLRRAIVRIAEEAGAPDGWAEDVAEVLG